MTLKHQNPGCCCASGPPEDCTELIACLANSDFSLTIAGVQDGNCPGNDCHRWNGSYNLCGPGLGCINVGSFFSPEWGLPESFICTVGYFITWKIGLLGLIQGIEVTLQHGLEFATYVADVDSLGTLCTGEPVTLTKLNESAAQCVYPSTITLQKFSNGTLSCDSDPPPPPSGACDGLTNCALVDVRDAQLVFIAFEDYKEPFASHFFFTGAGGETNWTLANLNTSFTLPVDGGPYSYTIDLYSPGSYTAATAPNAGILIRGDKFLPGGPFTDPVCEAYVYRIHLQIQCTDGNVTIEYIQFEWEQFFGSEGNEPTSGGFGSSTFSEALGTLVDTPLVGNAAICLFGPTLSLFKFSGNFFTPVAGDAHSFLAFANSTQ